MNEPTDQLIAQLASQAVALQPVSYRRLLTRWVLACLAYGAVVTAISGLRPDFWQAVMRPFYAVELLLLLALLVLSVMAGAALAFPDGHAYARLVPWPRRVAALFALLLGLAWAFGPAPVLLPEHSWQCLSCISLYALLPGAVMFLSLRRMATTRAAEAGALAALASFSLGALLLRLHEATDSIAHLVTWHYGPMLVVSLLGMWLGRWLLKW